MEKYEQTRHLPRLGYFNFLVRPTDTQRYRLAVRSVHFGTEFEARFERGIVKSTAHDWVEMSRQRSLPFELYIK